MSPTITATPTALPHTMVERHRDSLRITLTTGVRLHVALDGDRILGIRDVVAGDVALRNPAKLWYPAFNTGSGIHYREFRLRDILALPDGGVRLVCDAIGLRTGVLEEQDEYLCDQVDVSGSDEPVVDAFSWELRPVTRRLGDLEFAGFSYTYHFAANDPARRIWRIFDYATWEIGGTLAGNQLLLQGQLNPPATDLTRETWFTTACNYYGAQMVGVMGPAQRVSFQRLPRLGTLQMFDFLSHASGVLVNLFEPVEDVMTIVQSNEGEDLLHVIDELRRPLAATLETHPKLVLFHTTPTALARHDVRNLWKRVLDHTHDAARALHGIKPSPVVPHIWIPQTWQDPMSLAGKQVPRNRHLQFLADEVMPRWADMGVDEITVPSLWISDYTVDRLARKEDTGFHGTLTVSGICSVRSHEIDPIYGGVEAVAYFVERAHKLNMKVQLWYATHLSRRAPIFKERPDFMLMARDGLPNGGGFGKQVLITMDLANQDCWDWEFAKLKALYEATGFDGFFHDSYGNMTFLPVSYGTEQRLGQQAAYGRLMRACQDLGMTRICAEGLGPWAVGHFGMDLVMNRLGERGRYQNALDWWLNDADMIYGLNMGIHSKIWTDEKPSAAEFAFRTMAAGGRFGFGQVEGGLENWTGWWLEMNRLHRRLGPIEGAREMLADDHGMVWRRSDGSRLLFAFKAFDFATGTGTTHQVTPDGDVAVTMHGDRLAAQPWSVYRLPV